MRRRRGHRARGRLRVELVEEYLHRRIAPLVRAHGADYANARVWLAQPPNAFLILALVLAVIYHALLGVQVVVEDYIHTRWLEVAVLTSVRLLAFLAALATSLAIMRISVGG